MLSKDILQLSKQEFENLDLGLNIDVDLEKIRLITQWHNLYNKPTTTNQMKLALEINLERLLCLPTQ